CNWTGQITGTAAPKKRQNRNQNRPKLPQTDSVNLSSPYPRKKIDRKPEWGNSVLPEHYEMANLG
ncbi:MAG: hypothetical protein OXD43_03405, partial [Bacteroidetes bacterium]|nr:hypothetical protein [Bacteroidota bacterium]